MPGIKVIFDNSSYEITDNGFNHKPWEIELRVYDNREFYGSLRDPITNDQIEELRKKLCAHKEITPERWNNILGYIIQFATDRAYLPGWWTTATTTIGTEEIRFGIKHYGNIKPDDPSAMRSVITTAWPVETAWTNI